MAEFLLEIGCEEIPAPWLPGLGGQMSQLFEQAASREYLEPTEVRVLWTPRRLVLRADVLGRQSDGEERVRGPALEIAKDPQGKWTRAAEGFAKRHGLTVADLTEDVDPSIKPPLPQKVYVFATKRTTGRESRHVLPGVVAAVLRGLAFPKRMSWDAWLDDGKGAFPFGRPIRWLVALLDGEVVPFTIHALVDGGKGEPIVRSGSATHGHRFLPRGAAGRAIRVGSFAELREKLQQARVVLDPAEREATIRAALAPHAAEIGNDHGLVEEWRDLVEHPTVVFGRIPDEFATLPHDVLATVLVHHQKYLPLEGAGGITRFAAVTNADASSSAGIVRGMERVVVARLRDAAFFYAEDLKRPLADRVADLAGVAFHQKLGSYQEKAERMGRLVDRMGAELGLLTKPEHEAARQAARLAKADLTTLMVREFTELQGVMGGIYLRAQGNPWENVAKAVRWHYHPVSIEEGSAPAAQLAGSDATVFGAVSIADKLDTLAGYFGLGQQPTGSSDPYGLRRAGQGAVRVLLDFWSAAEAEGRPGLPRLVAAAIAGYAGKLPRPEAEIAGELEGFLLDRLRYVLVARGYPADEVEAALGAVEPDALEDPHEALVRLKALHKVRAEAAEDFEHLATAFKRARNILGEQREGSVDEALLGEAVEQELFGAVRRLQNQDGGYEARLRSLASLRAPVDRFFDDVLVMAEDPKLRRNRLGLLAQALSLFYRIADISKLGG